MSYSKYKWCRLNDNCDLEDYYDSCDDCEKYELSRIKQIVGTFNKIKNTINDLIDNDLFERFRFFKNTKFKINCLENDVRRLKTEVDSYQTFFDSSAVGSYKNKLDRIELGIADSMQYNSDQILKLKEEIDDIKIKMLEYLTSNGNIKGGKHG